MKIAAYALLLCGTASTATARKNARKNNKPADAKASEQRNLFQDDENFWSRFVQEVTSSSVTEAPTPAPSASPSEAPTGICFAESTIFCFSEDNVECGQLTRPDGQCSIGGSINTVRFQIDFCLCADGINTQEGYFENCVDLATLPLGDTPATVTCSDPSGSPLLSETVVNGDEVTITSAAALPSVVSCSVASESGNTLQTFDINTSGTVDLYLKDKFGSFLLIACDEQDCFTEVTYSYEVDNTGNVDMVIQEFSRTRDGETVDLLGGTNPNVPVGETYTDSDSEMIDTCVSGEYTTDSSVAASPLGGVGCEDTSTYSFEILDNCRVVVEIECKNEDGTECKEIVPPTGSCTAGDAISTLKWRYNSCTCDEAMNLQDGTICSDSAPFPSGPATVECVAAEMGGGSLNVVPSNVESGDTLVITSPSGGILPAEILCTISDGSTTVQEFSFFTQDQALNLDNKFGSFELVSCEDEDGTELTCEQLLCYIYTIDNVGSGSMDLTHLNRTRGDETVSLFDLIPADQVDLERGDSVSIEEKELTNICSAETVTTEVIVEADPTSGILCFDEDVYEFAVTISPTPAPSRSPSASPSDIPSASPSASPSDIPSASPSAAPSESPTPAPTGDPTPQPTPEPTPEPSATPSASPSASPSAAPSESPTVEPPCVFELEIECIPPEGVDSCNATPPPVEQCQGRPFEMGFIYNGGDCEGSYNIQAIGDKFTCEDLNGGPPVDRGETSYIVVTALKDDTLYFEGTVAVGDPFTLFDGGENFVADQIINIYRNEDTSDPANLLQAMVYHSSCSQNLFLKDRFGAVQLVEWVNEVQGRITCFANQTFDLDIQIPVDIRGDTATMETLTIASNVEPFFFNLTDKVAGVEVQAGDTLEVTIAVPIDLTSKKTYNLLVTLTAITNTGTICRATELVSFTAGYPLPPIFPTFSPTSAPSGAAALPVDPGSASCVLDTDIACETASGRSCQNIVAPTSAVCSDDDGATAVEFLLTGSACGTAGDCSGGAVTDSEAFVEVVDRDRTAFAGVVAIGEIFRVSGPFDQDQLEVTIYSVVNGAAGAEFQSLNQIDLGCGGTQGEDLTLLTNYGALQLVGFSSASQGSQSIIETFTLTMSVNNDGSVPATLTSAVGTSPFEPEPINLISGPTDLAVGASVNAVTSAVLNLAESSGSEFAFELSAAGSSPNGDLCDGIARFVISVA